MNLFSVSVNSTKIVERMSELNDILNHFTSKKLILRKSEKSKALHFWEPIVKDILERVKKKDIRFAGMEMQFKGSYYERCKVGEPDEFDLMLVMRNLELNGDPYDDSEDDGMSEPPTGRDTNYHACNQLIQRLIFIYRRDEALTMFLLQL